MEMEMARIEEVTVILVDDFDGTQAAETVKFSLDGRTYEIDLSKPNASELRRTLRPYVDRARSARHTSGARRVMTVSKSAPGPNLIGLRSHLVAVSQMRLFGNGERQRAISNFQPNYGCDGALRAPGS
jgi:hypothetical protein